MLVKVSAAAACGPDESQGAKTICVKLNCIGGTDAPTDSVTPCIHHCVPK
jgi:hypothetical protein